MTWARAGGREKAFFGESKRELKKTWHKFPENKIIAFEEQNKYNS